MRKLSLLFSILLSSVTAPFVKAEPLPPQQSASLSERERQLNNLSFYWKASEIKRRVQPSALRIKRMQDATRMQYPRILIKQGFTDKAQINRMVESEVKDVPNMMGGGTDKHTVDWNFTRRGEEALIRGESKGSGLQDTYSYYYHKENAIAINDSTQSASGNKVQVNAPVAWACSGDSLRYRQPVNTGLTIMPEQVTVLLGLSPISMYGSQWQVTSQDVKSWVVETSLELSGLQKSLVKVTLSRNYDAAPSIIEVTQPHRKITVRALQYKKYKGAWICSKASFTDAVEGIQTIEQNWILEKVVPAQPFKVTSPNHLLVDDYRLFGSSLITEGVPLVPTQAQADKLIHYLWKGDFPSIDELKKLQQEQHPGEVFPDPNQPTSAAPGLSTPTARSNLVSNALPFAGGLLCLVGSVWMFQHRRVK